MRKVNALKASKAFNTWRKSADAVDGCDKEEFEEFMIHLMKK